jgi:3-deoxy-7-phosphoheptulonate synthase
MWYSDGHGPTPVIAAGRRETAALTPRELLREFPARGDRAARIEAWRDDLRRILAGSDHRLAVIVGPCSVHDTGAAVEYAGLLARASAALSGDLMIIMRGYVEKPRTATGWKGLTADPYMTGEGDPDNGLRLARDFFLRVTDLGLPVGCELVSLDTHLYLGDLVTWAAIGARTTESQPHREVVSGLPMPACFKNAASGNVQAAVNACRAASVPHTFRAPGPDGLPRNVTTSGNPDCHMVLRGGDSGPNYEAPHVAAALRGLSAAGLPARVMIDASHGNSGKDPALQPQVADAVAAQVPSESGIKGIMLESYLLAGRQETGPLPLRRELVRGQSVTDACLSWKQTELVLHRLAAAAAARR